MSAQKNEFALDKQQYTHTHTNGNHGKAGRQAMQWRWLWNWSWVCIKHNLCTPFMYLSFPVQAIFRVYVSISTCLHARRFKIRTLKFFMLGNFSDHEPLERIKFLLVSYFFFPLLTCVVALFLFLIFFMCWI